MTSNPHRDVQLPTDHPQELLIDKHKNFLITYASNSDGYEQIMVDYLRMSGIYWSLTAMDVMGSKDLLGIYRIDPIIFLIIKSIQVLEKKCLNL